MAFPVEIRGGNTPLFSEVISGRELVPVPVPPCTVRVVTVMVVVVVTNVVRTTSPDEVVVALVPMSSHSAMPSSTEHDMPNIASIEALS